MKLRGTQHEKFEKALCKAFPEYVLLERFALHKLELRLNEIAAKEEGLLTVAYKLLVHAEANNMLVLVLRQARRANPGNPELQDIEKHLLPQFSTEQLQKLETLLEQSLPARERLEELAQLSAPPDWTFPPPGAQEGAPEAFLRLIDSLSSAPRQAAGDHPLLRFVQHLAVELKEPVAQQLEAWSRENSEGLSLPSSGGGAQGGPKRLQVLHLFVKCDSGLREQVGPEDDVTVTVWLWCIGEDLKPISRIPVRVLDGVSCPLQKVPEQLTLVLNQPKVTALLLQARGKMSVEVCLRHALLSTAVEDWRTLSGRTSVRLGAGYPVLVRSFERLYEPYRRNTWGLWLDKWERLKSSTATLAEHSVEWIGSEKTGTELIERVMQEEVLCVVSPMRCGVDVLDPSIDAGAPTMLWLRLEGSGPEDVKSYLASLLKGPLAGLPERVHAVRKKATAEGALARHITLLWDDYDRVPPDAEDTVVFGAPPVG